jgi:RimK family alpha-L-glutamate ligase
VLLTAGIVSSDDGWHERTLTEALTKRGVRPVKFHPRRFCTKIAFQGESSEDHSKNHIEDDVISECDMLFVRSLPGGSLEQVIYRMNQFWALMERGVFVVNHPQTIERTVDKCYSSLTLEQVGLRTPPTVVTERSDEAMEAFDLWGDVVVKPLFGSRGKGMCRITDRDVAIRVFSALEMGRYVYYVQKFIPHGAEDIRAFVVEGEVVAAIVRRSESGSWKTNVAGGAQSFPLNPDSEIRRIGQVVAQSFGGHYLGIDILPASDGTFYVIEVNGIPGFRAVTMTTGVDVAGKVVDAVLDRVSGGGVTSGSWTDCKIP